MLYRLIALGAAGLVALSSCMKEEAPAPAKPYYQFTAADQAWVQPPTEDWVFVNAQGRERRYELRRVTDTKQSCQDNSWGVFEPTIYYYYDEREVVLTRVDSLESITLRFWRELPAGNDRSRASATGSALRVRVRGTDMLGTLPDELVEPGYNFYPDLMQLATELVNGQAYTGVVTLETTTRACQSCSRPRRIHRISYDQRYGVVRMESVTGEIWNRVR